MAVKKKHLKYQARKAPSVLGLGSSKAAQAAAVEVQKKLIKVKKNKLSVEGRKEPAMTTELTAAEATVVRRELLHLLVSASIIVFLYAGLWLLLDRAGVEARLIDIIKL